MLYKSPVQLQTHKSLLLDQSNNHHPLDLVLIRGMYTPSKSATGNSHHLLELVLTRRV